MPDGRWTWYASEFDSKNVLFGFVEGDFPELGDFALDELQLIRGRLGLPVERDKFFQPTTLRALMDKNSAMAR